MKLSIKLLSVLVIPTSLISCTAQSESTTDGGVSVKIVQAVSYAESGGNEFPFISKPYRSSELSFRVGGPVNVMDLHSGNYYRKGDVIATIDSRDYQVKIDRAKALFEQAEAEYKRVEALYKLNNISASAYEKAKADYQSASAAYTAAGNDLGDTRLIAPFDGYIQDVLFEQFQDVKPSQPICSFIDVDRIKIEVFVPQHVALSVKKGEVVTVQFDALPQKSFIAAIEQISKGVTKNNLSFLLTAVLRNTTQELPSGMSGKILVHGNDSLKHCVAVAQNTIRHNREKGTYVWKVKDGKATNVPVVTGKLLKDGMLEVTEGVNEGDAIITTGIELLHENQSVRVLNK